MCGLFLCCTLYYFSNYAVGLALPACGAGFMHLSGVCPPVCLSTRPSVCRSTGPQQQTRCCRFAAAGPAGRRYRLIAARRTAARRAAGRCRQCHIVSVCRKLNTDCFSLHLCMFVSLLCCVRTSFNQTALIRGYFDHFNKILADQTFNSCCYFILQV